MFLVLVLWCDQGVEPSRAPCGSQALTAVAVSPESSIEVGISPAQGLFSLFGGIS